MDIDQIIDKPKNKKQTVAEVDEEIRQLELEMKRLELQDVRDRIAERQLAREARGERSRNNGKTISQNLRIKRLAQRACTHRKGGNGLADYVGGKGQDSQYSVIKHIFMNGDMWVRCQRCGNTWKPPLEEFFYFDEDGNNCPPSSDEYGAVITPKQGKFNKEKFQQAVEEYKAACLFSTKNITSSSYMFRYSDGGLFSRKIMAHSNLE